MPLAIPFFFVCVAQAVHPPETPDRLWLPILIQVGVVGPIACLLGLLLARKIGCGAPYLEHRLYGI